MRRATMIAVVLLSGCGSMLQGSLTADWKDQDRHVTMTPDVCESGERNGFFGVDMWTEGNEAAHIRAILDAKDGPAIKVDVPGLEQTVTLVPGAECETLELTVERQDARTNNIVHVHGHLKLDCKPPGPPGLVLHADIVFADCH